jgi:H+/Cl- antiporter ClcA
MWRRRGAGRVGIVRRMHEGSARAGANGTAGGSAAPDPVELLRSRRYVAILVLGALVGVPVATIAYFFLKAVGELQHYVFTTLPGDLGFDSEPAWWPIPMVALGGVLVALAITRLPGTGGHEPSEGFKAGQTQPVALPGVVAAALATLSFGAVLGPEAPLIALGGGLGLLAIDLTRRDVPDTARLVIGVAGSFAAVSTLLGSPLTGAFLLMETGGIGGPLLGVVLTPGLLAAGVGALIFIGLDSWTGFGTFSLAVPNIPPFGSPDVVEFLWAIGAGVAGAAVGVAIRRSALTLQPIVARRRMLWTPAVGVAVGCLAVLFGEATDRGSSHVLFSGQDALPGLIHTAGGWTVGALVLLIVCKGVAYSLSLSAFRGGPVFPGMFVGAAGGIALSHLPGLPMIAGAAIGIGAVSVAMLRLPLTAVLLTSLFLQADGLALMPIVIVAVVVSHVVTARLELVAGIPSAGAGGQAPPHPP